MTTSSQIDNRVEVTLSPSYKIPLALIISAIAISFFSFWVAGIVALLGLFLTIQTVLIRLQFTDKALLVLRSGKVLREFPYSEWLNWEIFWSGVPILFYFREVNSIHFLPIIFDPETLRNCLNKYYPGKE